MKKLLTFTLSALMLLTSLTSCRMQERTDPFKEILEENPEMELPKSEVMEVDPESIPKYEIKDSLSNYEAEMTFDIPAEGDHAAGTLVVKYQIYDFAYEDRNVAVVSVENHSTQALTVSIDGKCENTLEGKTKNITRSFEGFAAGWQNYFIFDPKAEFDEFSYEIDFEYYDGETYGQNYQNLAFHDIRLWSAEFLGDGGIDVQAFWFYDYTGEPGGGFAGGYVLFDEFGDVLHCDAQHWPWYKAYVTNPANPNDWERSQMNVTLGTDNSFLWKDVTNLGKYNFASPSNYEPGEGFEVVNGIVAFNAMYPEIPQEAADRIAAGLQ